jgi:hypothetical protein
MHKKTIQFLSFPCDYSEVMHKYVTFILQNWKFGTDIQDSTPLLLKILSVQYTV